MGVGVGWGGLGQAVDIHLPFVCFSFWELTIMSETEPSIVHILPINNL